MPNSKNIQPILDEIDRELIKELSVNARISNAELASRVGIAPSTALMRVRNLVETRVIRSFNAEVSPSALGLELQAVISVTLRAGARANLAAFMQSMREHPQVIQVFFLGGAEDFLVHVAVRNSEEIREFVLEQLSNNASVANTRTNIVFDHSHKGPIG
jgi:DNA-binding Lrp family transcriptional regulator